MTLRTNRKTAKGVFVYSIWTDGIDEGKTVSERRGAWPITAGRPVPICGYLFLSKSIVCAMIRVSEESER